MYVACTICACLRGRVQVCSMHNMRMLGWVGACIIMYVACTICVCLCRCVHVCSVHNMRILRWVVHVCSVHNMRVFDGACAGMQHAQYAHVRVGGCLGGCVHVSSCM